ncbi:unnamed protein product [Angiostrongylus costaricensis]|uniref:Sepiapterin reductase n=1 Tax=Angiostrongylus costaricensis TaxID=334426 RepID=A0A0R3PW49_ANGCS|nr:unnamed protein product [Angiostrongylus costaricensis]
MVLIGKRVLAVISGASRGIGKEIAVQISKQVAPNSAFLLTARNETALLQIKQDILNSSEKAQVWIVVCDMGSLNSDAIKTFTEVLEEMIALGPFDSAFIFHNCGTVGDVSKRCSALSNPEQWHNYLNVNLIAMIQFNNLLLSSITEQTADYRFVVNITSLLAIQGFPSLTQYSVGKAAREAFFRGLAVDDETIKVLSYSPGPVDTAMHDIIAKEQFRSFDENIRAAFSRQNTESHDVHRTTLTTTQTVVKMLKHLEENKFDSGSRIDYFDDENS